MSTTVTINQDQINSVTALLSGIERDANKAIMRSLNRTATGAKTLTAKEVAQTVTLKSKKIKELLKIRKANRNSLSAKLTLIGKPMPAVFFTNRKLRKGVSIKIFKNQSSAKFRHFFYATMPGGGHRGIFSRKEISPGVYHRRLPIVESFGPSITTVYEQTSGLARRLERHSADRLLRELDAQVNFILTRRGNG